VAQYADLDGKEEPDTEHRCVDASHELSPDAGYSLWLAVCYPKVEINSCDEHVGLEANFVYARRWKRDGQSDHAHQRWSGLSRMAKYILRPQTTQQQHDLRTRALKKQFLSLLPSSDLTSCAYLENTDRRGSRSLLEL